VTQSLMVAAKMAYSILLSSEYSAWIMLLQV
jgi:hypothetical protein